MSLNIPRVSCSSPKGHSLLVLIFLLIHLLVRDTALAQRHLWLTISLSQGPENQ